MSRLLDPKRNGKYPHEYAPAKSHEGSAEAFAKRQRERLEAARATAAEAKAKTRNIKRESK